MAIYALTFCMPYYEPVIKCKEGEEKCIVSGECILREQFCDGHVDCEDSTDEQLCTDTMFPSGLMISSMSIYFPYLYQLIYVSLIKILIFSMVEAAVAYVST